MSLPNWLFRPFSFSGRLHITPLSVLGLVLFRWVFALWFVVTRIWRMTRPRKIERPIQRGYAPRYRRGRRHGPQWRPGDKALGFYDADDVVESRRAQAESLEGWALGSAAIYDERCGSALSDSEFTSFETPTAGYDCLEPQWDSDFGGSSASFDELVVNPASGLLMVGGIGGLDAEGNSFGSSHHDDSFSSFDDFGASSSFDSFSSGSPFDND